MTYTNIIMMILRIGRFGIEAVVSLFDFLSTAKKYQDFLLYL